jgi:hypothetical protein
LYLGAFQDPLIVNATEPVAGVGQCQYRQQQNDERPKSHVVWRK